MRKLSVIYCILGGGSAGLRAGDSIGKMERPSSWGHLPQRGSGQQSPSTPIRQLSTGIAEDSQGERGGGMGSVLKQEGSHRRLELDAEWVKAEMHLHGSSSFRQGTGQDDTEGNRYRGRKIVSKFSSLETDASRTE